LDPIPIGSTQNIVGSTQNSIHSKLAKTQLWLTGSIQNILIGSTQNIVIGENPIVESVEGGNLLGVQKQVPLKIHFGRQELSPFEQSVIFSKLQSVVSSSSALFLLAKLMMFDERRKSHSYGHHLLL